MPERKTTAKQRRDANRKYCTELLGGKCVKCNSITNLDFDHIDPATKSFELAAYFHCSLKKLIPEVMKCQLLCKQCHEEKTQNEGSRMKCAGEKHPSAKLTVDNVQYIRINPNKLSQYKLAIELGVSRSLVAGIQRGEKWRHLPIA